MEAHVSPRTLSTLPALRFPELALSAYVPTGRGADRGSYHALLEDLARADLHKLTARERAALRREVPEVLAVLERRRFDCPAVAVFSCWPQAFLRTWQLAEPLPGRIAVADRLDLAPIRLQLFEHAPALAAVVDKHQATLYTLILDELTELGRLEGLPIRRHKQGGWSAAALQRRQDEHANSNLSQVAKAVADALRRTGYRRLILAGPTEARARLRSLLPPSALQLLAAQGPIPAHAAAGELAGWLRRLDRQVQRI